MALIVRPNSKARRCAHARGRRQLSVDARVARAVAFLIGPVIAFTPSPSQSQTASVRQPALLRPARFAGPCNPAQFQDVDVEQATAAATRFRTDAAGDKCGSPGAEAVRTGSNGTARSERGRRSKRNAQATPPPEADAPPAVEADPYEPTGVKAGNFLLKPALEVKAGYDSNPTRLPGGKGSPVIVVGPELAVRSQFDRHELNADLRASYTEATAVPAARQPTADLNVNGRYDVTDKTAINGEARYNLDVGAPVTLGVIGLVVKPPLVNTFGGTAGVTHKFDPVEVSLKASLDRTVFQNSPLTNSLLIADPAQALNMIQYGAQTRVTYALTTQFKPFVTVGVDRRVHDQQVDFNGFRRDSTGTAVEVGATLLFPGKLAGDLAVGYLTRKLDDPLLPNFGGFIADASLAYLPTEKTTFLFVAKSQAIESAGAANSGVLRRDGIVEVDQQFNPQLTGSLRSGFGRDVYAGTARADNRYFVGAGIVYKFSRLLQFKIDLQQEWLHSNMPMSNVTATVVTIGARTQY